MPTVVTRYLNTGSTAGGDGTTNATTGANRAWATLNEAITQLNSAYSNNLVTADVQVDLIAEGATDDTSTAPTWPTSDATRYVHLQVPTADRKVTWDSNVYTLFKSTNFTSVIFLNTHTVYLTGIQVHHGGNLNLGSNNGIFVSGGTNIVAEGVKIRRTVNIGGAGVGCGSLGSCTFVWRNCVAIGFLYGFQFVNMTNSTTIIGYNNTSIGDNEAGSIGFWVTFTAGGSGKVARIKNHLSQVSASGVTITNATTSDTATNHHNTGTDASFVDSANANYRLTAADTVARNLGTDLSGVADWPFSIDGDVTTRPVGSAWDIGAHEELTPDVSSGYAFIL